MGQTWMMGCSRLISAPLWSVLTWLEHLIFYSTSPRSLHRCQTFGDDLGLLGKVITFIMFYSSDEPLQPFGAQRKSPQLQRCPLLPSTLGAALSSNGCGAPCSAPVSPPVSDGEKSVRIERQIARLHGPGISFQISGFPYIWKPNISNREEICISGSKEWEIEVV